MNQISEKTIFENNDFSDADVRRILEERLSGNSKFYSSVEAKQMLGVKVIA